MTDFESDVATAGDALRALADGPGREAAEALETAFGRAGERIEDALQRAARTGELDFERMAESILRDLARVAAEAVVAMSGISGARGGSPVNFNMNFAGGSDTAQARTSRNAVATSLVRLVAQGGRFI
jgi:Lambda phage tail tape-measure protein (Tape_meas_lam_C)